MWLRELQERQTRALLALLELLYALYTPGLERIALGGRNSCNRALSELALLELREVALLCIGTPRARSRGVPIRSLYAYTLPIRQDKSFLERAVTASSKEVTQA
jgi:hypothetical protein